LILAGCDSISSNIGGGKDSDGIKASGVIEADQITIASELNGRVKEVLVEEGTKVTAGDLVLVLEDDLLFTQKSQVQAQLESAVAQLDGAKAAEDAAQAYLRSAELGLAAADIQYQQILALVQSEDRVSDWNESTPNQIEVPAWYFQKPEQISAAEKETERAREFYQDELENYQDTAEDIGKEEFQEAEQTLAEAQAAYEIVDALNDRQVGYKGREEIEDFIKTIYDNAESELIAAQKAYDQILTDPDYEDILEARARVSVAKEFYDLARDYLYQQYTGEYSLEVQAAEAVASQAEAGVYLAQAQITQAENNRISAETAVKQAEAGLQLVDLQLEKLQIYSPITGVILTRTIDPGEILAAGYSAFTVGDLSHLTVTVYLPEDKYGQITLGDIAELTIDSFPDEAFEAVILRIADEAEYTPRNVQTQEERQNTVYAIELAVKNEGGKMKPGMPADVVFEQ
jgi:multidrug resistance efflux pump